MKPRNPFVISGYRGAEYFCDRIQETKAIISALENERNVTLMAPRRYGKTGLIKNVFATLPENVVVIYLDIYSTTCQREFTQAFAKAVLGVLDTNVEKALGAIGTFFSRMRPTMSPDGAGGVAFSFTLSDEDSEQSLKGIFDYIASKNRRIVVAIDEFQQILSYPEKGTEALLRSYIQFAENVNFIFAGSQHHLMGEMFTSPRHPFYQSTDILTLDVIACKAYQEFASAFFKKDGRVFSAEAFVGLYDRFQGITWYMQSILNRIWGDGDGLRDMAQVESVIESLVDVRALTFHDLLSTQTENARKILKALAKEGVVAEITAGEFLRKYNLTAPSSVRTTLATLLERDLVYKTAEGYQIYDRLFAEYLKHLE